MKHIPCVQGSEEWHRHRRGLLTASEMPRVITAKRWELATGRLALQVELVTELALDVSLDQVTTAAMQSGRDWEPKARSAYELRYGVDVESCGFCTTDDGRIGASPDGLVGEDGGLEIKSPFKPEHHMGYLLRPDSFKEEHFVQTQSQLYVTNRKWTDLVSYFAGLPMVCVRILPHPEFQAKLDAAVKTFLRELSDLVELAKARGVDFPAPSEAMPSSDWITESDLDEIIHRQREQRGAP